MTFDLREALSGIFMKGKYEVPADYSQFAINQYLSKYKQYIKIVAQLQLLKLPNKAHFKFLQKNVGYGFPNKVDIDKTKIKIDPIVEYLMRYYECSRRDAKDYLLFIDEDEINEIREFYEFEGDPDGKGTTNR